MLALCGDQRDWLSKDPKEVGQTFKVDDERTIPRPPSRDPTGIRSPGAYAVHALQLPTLIRDVP